MVNKEAVGVGDHRVYVGGQSGGGDYMLSRQGLHAAMIRCVRLERALRGLRLRIQDVVVCIFARTGAHVGG